MKSYTIKDFKVGDKVILADCGFRSWKNVKLREAYVVKVGRVNITISTNPHTLNGDNYRVDPALGYGLILPHSCNRVFLTEQDYQDYCNYLKVYKQFYCTVRNCSIGSGLTYEQMIRILDIIYENKEK